MAWTLCTKADVISIHPTTESALPDFWSDAIEDMIRQYLANPYLGLPTPITCELHDGDGGMTILVDKPPLISVEKLTINGVTLSPKDYRVLATGVELTQLTTTNPTPGPATGIPLLDANLWQGHLNISIDYTSGSATVDPIVRLCAAAMVVAMLNYRGRAGSDSSLKWGDAPQKEGESTPTQSVGLTTHLNKIMRQLLRRNKLRIA